MQTVKEVERVKPDIGSLRQVRSFKKYIFGRDRMS